MADPMPPLPLWKRCSGCKLVKPVEDFSFDRRVPSGRQSRCLACVREYQKRYRQADRERYLELRRQESQRLRQQRSAYMKANRERLREQRRQWVGLLEGDKLAAYREARRRASETYRLTHPDRVRESARTFRRAHPDHAADSVNRRRALKRANGIPEKFSRAEIGERDGWVCWICLLPIDKMLRFPNKQSQSLDHVIPLALGGEHIRANARIAHWICNVRRGTGERRNRKDVA